MVVITLFLVLGTLTAGCKVPSPVFSLRVSFRLPACSPVFVRGCASQQFATHSAGVPPIPFSAHAAIGPAASDDGRGGGLSPLRRRREDTRPSQVMASGSAGNLKAESIYFYLDIPLGDAEREAASRSFLAEVAGLAKSSPNETERAQMARLLQFADARTMAQTIRQHRAGRFHVEFRVLDETRLRGCSVPRFRGNRQGRVLQSDVARKKIMDNLRLDLRGVARCDLWYMRDRHVYTSPRGVGNVPRLVWTDTIGRGRLAGPDALSFTSARHRPGPGQHRQRRFSSQFLRQSRVPAWSAHRWGRTKSPLPYS